MIGDLLNLTILTPNLKIIGLTTITFDYNIILLDDRFVCFLQLNEIMVRILSSVTNHNLYKRLVQYPPWYLKLARVKQEQTKYSYHIIYAS